MLDPVVIFIAAVFLVAGLVKGVIGLGLPTISMGLLAVIMPPAESAALLIVPSLATNVWQMLAGPDLRPILGRLWPTMLGVCAGTWAGAGLMSGAEGRLGAALLGVALMAYALTGLTSLRLSIGAAAERWLGPLAGGVTGLITAATGVFVIPAVPYLQAIGLEKDDLVQALGLSFTVSTLALAVNLAAAGTFNLSLAGPSVGTLVVAGGGMWLGQELRARLSPAAFRVWFFIALFVLGLYLLVRATA
ncbi:MAG TPA: sulfite exporter TauE/SafE family protein [Hyphomicrobiaceae bacterium]